MDKNFKTFYQVDTTLARKHGGTGLGLVICKGIIEDQGGRIWIDRSFLMAHLLSSHFRLRVVMIYNLLDTTPSPMQSIH